MFFNFQNITRFLNKIAIKSWRTLKLGDSGPIFIKILIKVPQKKEEHRFVEKLQTRQDVTNEH